MVDFYTTSYFEVQLLFQLLIIKVRTLLIAEHWKIETYEKENKNYL